MTQSNPATLREALRELRSTAKDARYDWSEIMAIKIERIADEIEQVAASGTEAAHPPEYYDDVLKGAPDPGGESYYRQSAQAAASPEGEGRETFAHWWDSHAGPKTLLAKGWAEGAWNAALRQSAAPSGGAEQVAVSLVRVACAWEKFRKKSWPDRKEEWSHHWKDVAIDFAVWLAQESQTGAVTETK